MEIKTAQISLDLIDDPRISVRSKLDDPELEDLMADMEVHGLIEPVILRPVGNRYELIAGARRTRAARLLNWETILALVREASDDEAYSMRLAENLQRKDANPVDEASYVGEIMLREKKSPEQIMTTLHRSKRWVDERIAVFKMDAVMQEYLFEGRISLGAALELSQIEREKSRIYYTHWAAQNGVSIANAKAWKNRANAIFAGNENAPPPDPGSIERVETPRVFVSCGECGVEFPQEEAEYVAVHKVCPSEQA